MPENPTILDAGDQRTWICRRLRQGDLAVKPNPLSRSTPWVLASGMLNRDIGAFQIELMLTRCLTWVVRQ